MNVDQLRRANQTDAARLRVDVLRALSACGARADFVEVDQPDLLAVRIHPLTPEREMRLHGLLARLQGVVGAPLSLEHGVVVLRFQTQNPPVPR